MGNADSWAEIMEPIDAAQKAAVQADTWGHLVAEEKKVYKGWIIFMKTAWGHIELYDVEFEELDISPWLYSHLNDYISKYIMEQPDTVEKGIWKFEGTYSFTDHHEGDYKFIGNITEIEL